MIKGKIISFLNMKGGVGKTTLCKEVGFHLAKKRGYKVLFIDVDPQINLTQSLFKRYNFYQAKQISVHEDKETEQGETKKISQASIQTILSHSSIAPPTYTQGIQKLDDDISIIPGELGLEFSLRNLNSATLENGIHKFIDDNRLRNKFHFD